MSDFGFSFQATRGGDVRIARGGRIVTTLRGAAAQRDHPRNRRP